MGLLVGAPGDGLLVAMVIGAGELRLNGAKVTGAIAGDMVNGAVVSLCMGENVEPLGAKVTGVGSEDGRKTGRGTGAAVVEPSGDPVVIGIPCDGEDVVPDGASPGAAVLVGTVGKAGVGTTTGAALTETGTGAVVLTRVVGPAVTVGSTE